MNQPMNQPMNQHLRSLCVKNGKDLLTPVRGTTLVDVEDLRWLFGEYQRLRNDVQQDAVESLLSRQFCWIREFSWLMRDRKERISATKFFISRLKDEAEVIAVGTRAEDFRFVCDVPFYPDYFDEERIQDAADDEEAIRIVVEMNGKRWRADPGG